MAHENISKLSKIADLENGLSIWKVHLDVLRERDKNARVMSPEKFERLVENIKHDKRLESLPLCVPHTNLSGNDELLIISGHHRTRAARAAGLTEIYVLVTEEQLSKDKIISKQLAHNALSGVDDKNTLKELFEEISSIQEKLDSGVFLDEIRGDIQNVSVDDAELLLDYEVINILFLPRYCDRFEKVLDLIQDEVRLYVSDREDFERFKEVAQQTARFENVRNTASIMHKMIEICEEYFKNRKEQKNESSDDGNSPVKV